LKGAAGPLQDMPWLREAWSPGLGAFLIVFLAGAAVTVVAQSSSTVSILAIALHEAGVGSFEQAAIAVCGASFGSGLAALTMRRGLRGTALQPVFCQVALRSGGAALFVILIAIEHLTGLPLVLAGVAALAEQPDTRLALVFLGLQVAAALLSVPLLIPLERMLARLSPADATEISGQPRFLFPQALADAPSALPLLRAEQGRLLDRLPRMLECLCEGGAQHEPESGSAELEDAIRRFHAALVARELPPETLTQGLALGARLDSLVALRETVAEFAAIGLELSQPEHGVQARVDAMSEALHLLLEEARAIASPQDAAWVAELAADRGEMMQRIRRETVGVAQAGMFRLTGLFERAVWLVRRVALLEGDGV
jgi:phosphate:Na+ symporter